jgi:hypothetical protein
VLPAWGGSKTALAGSKFGDLGPIFGYFSHPETGAGRAPAGTTKSFRTALPRRAVDTIAGDSQDGKLVSINPRGA